MIQRYFWLAYLVLITLAAALGADMTVSYLSNRLSQSTVSEAGPSDGPTQDTARRPFDDYALIDQRNIFNAEPPGPEAAKPPIRTVEKPVVQETTLQLKLAGTVMGGDGANYAFIENMATRGNQQLYQVGDAIQNRVIVDIRDDCVILEQNGKKEQLCFPNREGSAGPAPNQQSVSREASEADNDNDDSNEDVVQVDDATWRIRRELMQEQFANLGGLAQQARVTPYVVQGETRGFRVTRLKANSLLQKIGLQHGDVLQKVNGNSITSPADALQAYQQLQQAGTVRLEILRRDRASTLTYEIR
jgi:general secretion pathway protein C